MTPAPAAPPPGEWPTDALEAVPACPLCGSAERRLAHARDTSSCSRARMLRANTLHFTTKSRMIALRSMQTAS